MVTGTTIPVMVNVINSALSVLDNRGNGSNGGIWDIQSSVVNFLRNVDHGLSALDLKVTDSDLFGNGNGASGIHVTHQFNASGSTIEVKDNIVELSSVYTRPGAFYLQSGAHTVENSILTLTGNQGPALHLYSGSLLMDPNTDLTIMDNRAYRSTFKYGSYSTDLYQRGAGVYVTAGSVTLPQTAKIYNNRALLEADDIFVKEGATLSFGPAFQGILNEEGEPSHPHASENHVIDGWYQDQIGAANRWIAHAVLPAVNHIVEFTGFGAAVPGPLTLKAAHALIEVSGKKTWVDGGTLARPDVVISLLADGEPATDANGGTVPAVTLTFPQVVYTFGNLLKYNADVKEIAYTVSEKPVAGYGTAVEGMNVINTYIVPLIDVTATKTWVGGPATDHSAPKFILVRSGVDLPNTPGILPATGTADSFTYIWKDLPATSMSGTPYVYTVREDGVTDGKLVVNGHAYTVSQAVVDGVTQITNTYVVPLTDVTATKTWAGGPDADHTAVTLTLLRGNAALDPQPAAAVTGTAPTFTYTWNDLPATDVNGVSYVYTVAEAGVANGQIIKNGNRYNVTQTGNAITNTFIPPVSTPTPVPPPPTYTTITVPLQGVKILLNRTLGAGQYTFELRDRAGKLLAEVTNAADGSFTFPDRTFSREVSNYIYTIRERAGSDTAVTYDATIYTVKVTTTAVNGKLQARVSLERDGVPYAGALSFTNVVQLPKTGDSYLQTAMTLAILSLLLGGAYLFGGRHRKAN